MNLLSFVFRNYYYTGASFYVPADGTNETEVMVCVCVVFVRGGWGGKVRDRVQFCTCLMGNTLLISKGCPQIQPSINGYEKST